MEESSWMLSNADSYDYVLNTEIDRKRILLE